MKIELNGEAATVDDLRHLVQTNYGHFSAMQVRNGGVRGLDLHLDRIERATRELFGTAVERDRVRAHLRHAIDGSRDALAVRINVFSRSLNRERPADTAPADVLVSVAPARAPASAPLRLKSFRYTRDLAHIKHVGTFPLFHYRRLAQQAGVDDAVFVDAADCIEEGSIWNIGFFDGDGVVWPDAPQLTGVSMQLLQRGLAQVNVASSVKRVALTNVAQFRAAFFTNSSTPVRLIASVDAVAFDVDRTLESRLLAAYERNPLQPV